MENLTRFGHVGTGSLSGGASLSASGGLTGTGSGLTGTGGGGFSFSAITHLSPRQPDYLLSLTTSPRESTSDEQLACSSQNSLSAFGSASWNDVTTSVDPMASPATTSLSLDDLGFLPLNSPVGLSPQDLLSSLGPPPAANDSTMDDAMGCEDDADDDGNAAMDTACEERRSSPRTPFSAPPLNLPLYPSSAIRTLPPPALPMSFPSASASATAAAASSSFSSSSFSSSSFSSAGTPSSCASSTVTPASHVMGTFQLATAESLGGGQSSAVVHQSAVQALGSRTAAPAVTQSGFQYSAPFGHSTSSQVTSSHFYMQPAGAVNSTSTTTSSSSTTFASPISSLSPPSSSSSQEASSAASVRELPPSSTLCKPWQPQATTNFIGYMPAHPPSARKPSSQSTSRKRQSKRKPVGWKWSNQTGEVQQKYADNSGGQSGLGGRLV